MAFIAGKRKILEIVWRTYNMTYKKLILFLFTTSLVIALTTMGLSSPAVRAEDNSRTVSEVGLDDPDGTSLIIVTGVVVSITPQNDSISIVKLDDGSELLVNPATLGAGNFVVGQPVTVVASMDDDGEQLVAKTVTLGLATPEPTDEATEVASETPEATDIATATPEATEIATGTPAATEAVTCGGPNAHPVATRLAVTFGVPYSEIMALHCQGIGFGNIAKAYLLKLKTGKDAKEFLDRHKSGEGWGNIIKGEGVKANELSMGQALKGNSGKKGKPTKAAPKNDDKGKGQGKKGK
jgi:hypothetical protein